MAGTLRAVRVFISYPSDMKVFVTKAKDVIAAYNPRWERDHQISVKHLTFRDLPSSHDPSGVQDFILNSISKQHEIFLGLMGPRFGKPSSGFGSGTEAEYAAAVTASEAKELPMHIMFGFSEAPLNPFSIDPDQLKRVKAFRKRIAKTQLHFVWKSAPQFTKEFGQQLDAVIYRFATDPNYFVSGGLRYK